MDRKKIKSAVEYSRSVSKALPPLKPNEPCGKAVQKILLQTLNAARQTAAGIKKDTDPEFIHDFRVAVRRTRSALIQIKNVFPREKYHGLMEDLKFFARSSNHLRDMDVYLLNRNSFIEMLPEDMRPGIMPFFNSLSKRRKKEFQGFINKLDGDRYQRLISVWETLVKANFAPDLSLTNAYRSAVDAAEDLIKRRYNTAIKAGKNKSMSIEDLHGLRIQCKKLRYLLEFFSSFFPKDEVELFIKQLKKIQDSLGVINDLRIQMNELKKRLNRMDLRNKRQVNEVAAMGVLISILYNKQTDMRKGFKTLFEEFSNKANSKLLHKLIKHEATKRPS